MQTETQAALIPIVTKAIALDETKTQFHYASVCSVTIGPKGGRKYSVEKWRRSGRTKTWVTRPNDFQFPIKWGMGQRSSSNGYITQNNAHEFHLASECPIPELRYA